MRNRIKAFGNIGFNDPRAFFEFEVNHFHGCMCTFRRTESMRTRQKGRLINGFQDQGNSFLDNFFHWRGHAKRAFFFFSWFRDPYSSSRAELVFSSFQRGGHFFQFSKGSAIQSFFSRTRGYVAWITFNQLICQDLQIDVSNYMNKLLIYKSGVLSISKTELYQRIAHIGNDRFSRPLICLLPFVVSASAVFASYHYYVSSVPIGLSPLRLSQSTETIAIEQGRLLHEILYLLGIPQSCVHSQTYIVSGKRIAFPLRRILGNEASYSWVRVKQVYHLSQPIPSSPLLFIPTSGIHRAFLQAQCYSVSRTTPQRCFTRFHEHNLDESSLATIVTAEWRT